MEVPPPQVVEQVFQIATSSLEFTPLPKDLAHDLLIGGEDVPPSPSVTIATKMTNDNAWIWVSRDAMPSAFVEFDSNINCDSDVLEMCDEMTYSPFVKLYDLEPH
ncbi:hypothetical protein Dimus_026692, partial [Dionaea muscipula]